MFSKFSTKFSTCREPFATSPELSCTGNTKQESVSHTKYFSTSAPKIEAVPQHLSLAPDRYYIKLLDGWTVPIQLTEKEAIALLSLVEGVRDRESVLRIVEGFLPSTIGSAS